MARPARAGPPGDLVVRVGADEPVSATRQTFLSALTSAPQDIVIDLRDMQELSYPQLALLLGVRARQRARHRQLTLVCDPHSTVHATLARTGTRGMFVTTDSLGEVTRR